MEEPSEWVVRDPRRLGAAIRYYRKRAGLTQEELADRAGVHRSYLSQLEGGHITENTDRLLRALRRLDVDIVLRPRRS